MRLIERPPAFLAPVLGLLERGYRFGVSLDQLRTERRIQSGQWPLRLPRPVVSVGNITVGGTGKTPVVELLAREWLRRGGRPAILSRGYRKRGGVGNDEFQLLARRLAGVPHGQAPSRFDAGQRVLSEHPDVDLFILDDGFQHRRLHRDIDIVVLDATRPLGFGHCLPRGLLREPWDGLARADHIVLSRTDAASPHKLRVLRTFLRERFGRCPITEVHSRVEGMRVPDGTCVDLDRSLRYAAFCGIGNPKAFFGSLEDLGLDVRATRGFRDHHGFSSADLGSVRRWAREHGANALLCTEKDGVKLESLGGFREGDPPIYQLCIRFESQDPLPLP